jgi:hypothetical protein
MKLRDEVLERVKTYETSSQWEKSEVGRSLRGLGLSYGEIMDLIPVKKSTLATWCRDVMLSNDQIDAIRERRAQIPRIPRDTRRKRHAEIQRIREGAAVDARRLLLEPHWTAGVALYSGEGSKTQNQLGMANADPAAL